MKGWDEAELQLKSWEVVCAVFLGEAVSHPTTYEMMTLIEDTAVTIPRLCAQEQAHPYFPASLLCLIYTEEMYATTVPCCYCRVNYHIFIFYVLYSVIISTSTVLFCYYFHINLCSTLFFKNILDHIFQPTSRCLFFGGHFQVIGSRIFKAMVKIIAHHSP